MLGRRVEGFRDYRRLEYDGSWGCGNVLPGRPSHRQVGRVTRYTDRLDMQEIDIQEDLEVYWRDIYCFGAGIMAGNGLDDVYDHFAVTP